MRPDETVLELAASPESATRARHAAVELAQALGAAAETCAGIAVAVTEAVANVVVHAYHEAPRDGLQVAMRGDARTIVIEIRDRGVGLRPREDSPGLGLGLGLMAELADDFEITERAAGGTRVQLRFALP